MAGVDKEQRIADEFQHLLDKSNTLFNSLREVPNLGLKQWQPYFIRTFDCFSRLWKLQQQYRTILRDRHGLKRWEIGDIASKIGQLYYHYYLKTSETNYLHESYVFYAAVRDRGYFDKVMDEKRADLAVKRLRYYARFLVTCMLLLKTDLVGALQDEFASLVEEYVTVFKNTDGAEWQAVLKELLTFLEADGRLSVPGMALTFRMRDQEVPAIEVPEQVAPPLVLKDAVVVGSKNAQVKFSELTLDIFRMMQALEREPDPQLDTSVDKQPKLSITSATGQSPLLAQLQPPGGTNAAAPAQPPPAQANTTAQPVGSRLAGDQVTSLRRANPHKHLLYKPAMPVLLLTLSSAVKEMEGSGSLLLYVSADGPQLPPTPEGAPPLPSEGYSRGGVLTLNRRKEDPMEMKLDALPDRDSLHPEDLLPFTRKPLFVVMDSNRSALFKDLPSPFGQPVVCLMSPTATPPAIKEPARNGSLFTLFLHAPLKALAYITGVADVPQHVYVRCDELLLKFYSEVARLFGSQKTTHVWYLRFIGDKFLRLLVLRFVFCCVVLRLAKTFQHKDKAKRHEYFPSSSPSIPENIVRHPSLEVLMLDIARTLDVHSQFLDK